MIPVTFFHSGGKDFTPNIRGFSPLYVAGPCALGLCMEMVGHLLEQATYGPFHDEIEINGKDLSRTDFWVVTGLYTISKVIKLSGRFFQCVAFAAAIGFALGGITSNPVVGWVAFIGCLIVTFALQLPHEFSKGENLFHSRAKNVHDVSCYFMKVSNLAINIMGGAIVGFSAGLVPGALVGAISVFAFQVSAEILNVSLNTLMEVRK